MVLFSVAIRRERNLRLRRLPLTRPRSPVRLGSVTYSSEPCGAGTFGRPVMDDLRGAHWPIRDGDAETGSFPSSRAGRMEIITARARPHITLGG